MTNQCEVVAKCEQTLELPLNTERKCLAAANDKEKDGRNIATMLKDKCKSFLEEWSGDTGYALTKLQIIRTTAQSHRCFLVWREQTLEIYLSGLL